jgi:hypothetical protein
MQLLTRYLCTALILMAAFSSAAGQAGEQVRGTEQDTRATSQMQDVAMEKKNAHTPDVVPDGPMIWIHLVGRRRIQVDDVIERGEGIWYKRGNVSTFVDRARVERIERTEDANPNSPSDSFEGSGQWSISDSVKVESFFMSRFNRPLPLSAFGQSELHNRWRLDHRNSMDVGLHPDSLQGQALIKFLRSEGIPFLAFRGPVPGVATGPHIHIGNGSKRLPPRL